MFLSKKKYSFEWTPNKRNFLICLFFCVCINFFIIQFLKEEQTIYAWDYAGYWRKFQHIGELFLNNPITAFKTIIGSIRQQDYNVLPVVFLLPFYFIFGGSRLSYLLALTNIFLIPSAILFYFLIKKIFSKSKNYDSDLLWISFPTVLLSVPILEPLTLGYVGVGGLPIIFLILIFLFENNIENIPTGRLIYIGLLLAFLLLFRRWLAYWIVAFFIAYFCVACFRILPNFTFDKCFVLVKNMGVIIVVFILTVFFIAFPIAVLWMKTNYGDIYSAYKYGKDLLGTIILSYHHIGLTLLSLTALGFFQSIIEKNSRKLALFLFIQLIFAYLLITRVTILGSHHYFIMIPTILIFMAYFVLKTASLLKAPIFKFFFLSIYLVVLIVNFVVGFQPKIPLFIKKADFLFTDIRRYPMIREDIGEIHRLIDILFDSVLVGENEKEKVYTLASSLVFSNSILRNALIDLGKGESCRQIELVYHVDKTSGFPKQFLASKYVIIAKPIQYHLHPNDQRIIGVLAELILRQKSIGKSYKKLPYVFTLKNNVKLYIFEKVKAFEDVDLTNLSNQFINFYPKQKDLFKIELKRKDDDLKTAFQSSTDIWLLVNNEKGFDRIFPLNQVAIMQNSNGLIIRSSGSDPHLALPLFNFSHKKELVVKIDITSPKDTVLKLYYATKSVPHYSEKQSLRRRIIEGKNVIFIQLPPKDYTGHFRLDPGEIVGEFLLHSIEIRGILKG